MATRLQSTQAPAAKTRKVLLGIATAVIAALLLVGSAEVLLRMSGRGPWRPAPRPDGEPSLHQPHPVLGWRAREGRFVVPAFAPGGAPTRHTFDAQGARITRRSPAASAPDVLFVGGSYTQGFAVDDEATYPWRIQQALPDLVVENRGTSGYGTLQSLMVLESVYASPEPPSLALYGLIGHHEIRNVGHPTWLRALEANARSGIVRQPWAELTADGSLVRHPPTGYRAWPLDDRLASVAFLEELVALARGRRRAEQAEAVTGRLIEEMDAVVRARGGVFAVALLTLTAERERFYRGFLAGAGIEFIDCARPLRRGELVPGEIHPNAGVHARFARCITPWIQAHAPRAVPDAAPPARP